MIQEKPAIESLSQKLTSAIGTPVSVILHTIFFIGIFGLLLFGWSLNQVLLILTTLLSIEAIYLALFIQITVNRASASLEEVEEDIDEIEKDIDDIQADEKEDNTYDVEVAKTLKTIENRLHRLQNDLDILRKKGLM